MSEKLRQAAQQILEAATDLTILTPREWQAVHGLKINALRAALAEQPAEQEPQTEDVATDAYSHACDEMVRWQRKRRLAGKEAGTTGSLCDGIAWLYLHIDTLERAELAQPAKREPLTSRELKHVIQNAPEPLDPNDVGRWVVNVCRAAIAAYERKNGIGGQS